LNKMYTISEKAGTGTVEGWHNVNAVRAAAEGGGETGRDHSKLVVIPIRLAPTHRG
jgi:hypothetical protein